MSTITNDKQILGSWADALTVSKRPSQVVFVELDVKGKSNTLSSEILEAFEKAAHLVNSEPDIKAVVLYSGKPDIFITGADIKEIQQFEGESQARELATRGQNFLKQLLSLKCPSIAAIEGVCLGGGLELALCTDRRVAVNSESTVLGLPELTIGLIPGLGGTQRLPRAVGYRKAIDMILSGKPVSANEAYDLGLVDKVVESKDDLLEAAEQMALELVESGYDRDTYRNEKEAKVEQSDGGLKKRTQILKTSRRMLRMRSLDHYPAPALTLEAMETGLKEGFEAGLEKEIDAFARLAVSSTARNLINVYFFKEMACQMAIRNLKKSGKISKIAIIGSGLMGKELAEFACESGIEVLLKGSSEEKTEQDVEFLKKKLELRLRSEGSELENKKDVVALTDLNQLKDCDLVIEAVYEELQTKEEVIKEVSGYLSPDCIFASNTSCISISKLAQCYKNPESFVGLHFFTPVNQMPLVELVVHDKAGRQAQAKAMAFIGQLGKVPVSVKDSPGFIVNRLLNTYILEAIRMAGRGIPINWIEETARNFGMPLAPFELLDELGWDLAISVSEILARELGERLSMPDNADMEAAKKFGGKMTSKGCYLWENQSKNLGLNPDFPKHVKGIISEEKPSEKDSKEIENWLFLTMIDEASRCLDEKVVKKARDIDMALVTGAGFPPFRGGLLRYADNLGIDYVIKNLEAIYTNGSSKKRQISSLLRQMQDIGRKFYSLS